MRVTLPPSQKVVGPEGVTEAAGLETLTVTVFVTVGQAVKTETCRVSGSAVPAAKVIRFEVAPEVIVPLPARTVHEYVAPGTGSIDAVWPVEAAQTVAGAVMAGVDGHPVMPTETLPELLAVLDSGEVVLTVAVFVTVVLVAGAVTLMVITGALVEGARDPIVHVTVLVPEQVQPAPVALLKVTPAGSVSTTVTSGAAPAPPLVTAR